jgi:hypothetical protein
MNPIMDQDFLSWMAPLMGRRCSSPKRFLKAAKQLKRR